MKKIISRLLVITMAVAFFAVAAQSVHAITFTRDLSRGTVGADVKALQEFLKTQGFFQGDTTTLFGSKTQQAVAQWQAANHLPSVGRFGPASRTTAQAMGSDEQVSVDSETASVIGTTIISHVDSGTPGCPAGALYNYMTGQPCNPTPNTGCNNGSLYNYRTGELCPTATTTSASFVHIKINQQPIVDNGTFVIVSIAGAPENKTKVSRWELQIGCSAGIMMDISKTDTPNNICNRTFTYYSAQMADPTKDYTIITSGVVNTLKTPNAAAVFGLRAFDAAGNQIGGDKDGVVFTSQTDIKKPSIKIFGSSGAKTTDSNLTVNLGDTFTISGMPQNLQGLSYYFGTGYPTAGYYNRAFFFDQSFGNNNNCGNNEASTNAAWTMTCTAKVPGTSTFYIEIYANGQIYQSNKVTVTILDGGQIQPTNIVVTVPRGTETVAQGESFIVMWNSPNPTQGVDVKLLNTSGQEITALTARNVRPANAASQSIGFNSSPSYLPLGQYKARVCETGTNKCADSSGYATVIGPVTNVNPNITQVTPQPVKVGQLLTVSLSGGGRSGNIVLTTEDGAKSWSTGYATDISVLNGFSKYDGSKLSFTIPSTIGRGVHPDGWWNEPIVPVTSGTYKLSVSSLDGSNNFVKSNVVNVVVGDTTAQPTITNVHPDKTSYNVGDRYTVTWNFANVPAASANAHIGIALTDQGGTRLLNIVNTCDYVTPCENISPREGAMSYTGTIPAEAGKISSTVSNGRYKFEVLLVSNKSFTTNSISSDIVTIPLTTVSKIPGDVDGNNIVDKRDLDLLGASYNKSTGQAGFDSRADFDNNGTVDFSDMLVIAKNYNSGTDQALVSKVPFGGDTNNDGIVNFDDLLVLARAYNSYTGSITPAYNIKADFNLDGRVDQYDLAILAKNYNKTTTVSVDPVTVPVTGTVQGVSTVCFAVTQTFGRGATDEQTAAQVTLLQQYLETQGFSLNPKGYFGPMTEASLKSWQTKNQLIPTGITDKFTRAKISKGCN